MRRINLKLIISTVIVALLVICAVILIKNEWTKKIIIGKGDHFFVEDLVVKKGEALVIMPGANLSFEKNKKILVEGKIIAKGTRENPIIFKSSGDYFWRGIKIQNFEKTPEYESYWKWFRNGDAEKEKYFFNEIKNGNVFTFCQFKDISNEELKLTYDSRWTGALEAYDAALLVSNSVFDNINYLGGVVTQRSHSVIKENEFISNQLHKQINITHGSVSLIYKNKITPEREDKQGCADGIWLINAAAIVYGNSIEGTADDGIQAGESYAVIGKNSVRKTLNDGIEVDDKKGSYIIFGNNVDSASDNGILVDNASAAVMNNESKNSDAGLTVRNGSTVLASNLVAENNNKGLFLFDSIPCSLNEKEFLKVKSDILNFPEGIYCSRICPDNICLPDSKPYSGLELVQILESHYTKNKDGLYYFYYLYNKDYIVSTIKSIFSKRTNIFDLTPLINDNMKEGNQFCFGLNNLLFMEDSKFNNNKTERLIFNDFAAKIDDNLNDYECNSPSDDYLCDFKNKEKVGTLENNLIKVLGKINKL